ncbi:hypothetical protein ACTXT7_012855 [Hymenolepis weldensis]
MVALAHKEVEDRRSAILLWFFEDAHNVEFDVNIVTDILTTAEIEPLRSLLVL